MKLSGSLVFSSWCSRRALMETELRESAFVVEVWRTAEKSMGIPEGGHTDSVALQTWLIISHEHSVPLVNRMNPKSTVPDIRFDDDTYDRGYSRHRVGTPDGVRSILHGRSRGCSDRQLSRYQRRDDGRRPRFEMQLDVPFASGGFFESQNIILPDHKRRNPCRVRRRTSRSGGDHDDLQTWNSQPRRFSTRYVSSRAFDVA